MMSNGHNNCPKAFTMAIFEAAASKGDENRCVICGQAAERMLRFADYTRLQPLEMRWCEQCWHKCLESGKLHNPLNNLAPDDTISPAYLVNELNLTELPLQEALERLYNACENLRGGCIRWSGSADLPLVGPVKIKAQPLGSTLDSMLGPVGLKWDIFRGVLLIAPSSEEIERMKQLELKGKKERGGGF